MPTAMIWVVDHRDHDHQPQGKLIQTWHVHDDEPPGPRYADFCALYNVWGAFVDTPPDIVGFFGYRKYLWLPGCFDTFMTYPAHAPNWYTLDKLSFDAYRERLAQWDGAEVKQLLAQYDILQAPPFPVDSLINDFTRSRSRHDSNALFEVIKKVSWDVITERIFPYLFITRWPVFDRMMREIEPIRQELDLLVTTKDSSDEAYKKRPMAYIMERVYSLWLENSGLSIKELPLLHCWEMSA